MNMHDDFTCDYSHLSPLVWVQVQSFVRGRSVRKRRDKLKAEGRAQSVPRDEMLPCKVKPGSFLLYYYVGSSQGKRGTTERYKNRDKHFKHWHETKVRTYVRFL